MQHYNPTLRLLWLDTERKPRTEPRREPFKRYPRRIPVNKGDGLPYNCCYRATGRPARSAAMPVLRLLSGPKMGFGAFCPAGATRCRK